jgi:hypothetical protein
VNGPLGLVADVQLPDLSSLAVGILVSYSLKEKRKKTFAKFESFNST